MTNIAQTIVEQMVEFAFAVFLLLGQIDHREGFVSVYAQTPTDRTIAYQQERGVIPQDLSPYDGLVAAYSCSWLGREGWLIVGDQSYYVLVFDCAHYESWRWMLTTPISVEVDYYFAQENPGVVHHWGRLEWVGD